MGVTVLWENETHHWRGSVDETSGRMVVDGDEVAAATGWTLQARGLCRGEVCIPLAGRALTDDEGRLDLGALCDVLDRPWLVDPTRAVAAVGVPRATRRAALTDRRAPDLELTDLEGRSRRLEEFAGRRRLLVAFASW
ncbi:MAG: hypothetical protein D6683_10905 [Actinomyces sp.]|nr:MAG: hypothetical protein D6683_10905 [Actinomyces sp.]